MGLKPRDAPKRGAMSKNHHKCRVKPPSKAAVNGVVRLPLTRAGVVGEFAASQMMAVHMARREKRQRLEEAASSRTLQNVKNLLRFQRDGMESRKQAFIECIATMGSEAVDALTQAAVLAASADSEPGVGVSGLDEPREASADNSTSAQGISNGLASLDDGETATTNNGVLPLDLTASADLHKLGLTLPANIQVVPPIDQSAYLLATLYPKYLLQEGSASTIGGMVVRNGDALDSLTETAFIDLFRMTRETFNYVVEELTPFLTDDASGSADGVRFQVAVALYVLGGAEMPNSPLSGVPEGQRIEHTLQFSRCVTKCLMPKVISMHDRLDSSMWNFQLKFGLRNCAGALNFTHIPIHLGDVRDESCDYLNSAGFRSIIMQAVVSSDFRFCDLSIGYPGRTPVDRVLYNSAIWRKAEAGSLFPASEGDLRLYQGPHPYLIAGTCYPLSEQIITPYQAPKFSDIEKRFNNSIYNALSVTQRAFKLLRSRFPFLLDLSGVSVEDTPSVVAACCSLHNICEARGEVVRSAWETRVGNRQSTAAPSFSQLHAATSLGPFTGHSVKALQFRELVKNSMIHNYDRNN